MKKILATSTFGYQTIIPKIVTEILKLHKGDQILFVIDEKDNIILERAIPRTPFGSSKMMRKLLATSTIYDKGATIIPMNISEFLKIEKGEQILFALDENEDIIIMGPIIQIPFIVSVLDSTTYRENVATIPRIVAEILKIEKGEQILFVIDEKDNIILKGPFIQIPLAAYILDTTYYGKNGLTSIPKIVTEILKLDKGDQILFVIDEKDNIILKRSIIQTRPIDCLEILGKSKIRKHGQIFLPINVAEILKLDKGDQVLFALDENEDIIIMGPIIQIPFIVSVLDSTTYREQTRITKIITDILKIRQNDQILFVLDEKGNVILKGPKID